MRTWQTSGDLSSVPDVDRVLVLCRDTPLVSRAEPTPTVSLVAVDGQLGCRSSTVELSLCEFDAVVSVDTSEPIDVVGLGRGVRDELRVAT